MSDRSNAVPAAEHDSNGSSSPDIPRSESKLAESVRQPAVTEDGWEFGLGEGAYALQDFTVVFPKGL